jgi:hypothetical protein
VGSIIFFIFVTPLLLFKCLSKAVYSVKKINALGAAVYASSAAYAHMLSAESAAIVINFVESLEAHIGALSFSCHSAACGLGEIAEQAA